MVIVTGIVIEPFEACGDSNLIAPLYTPGGKPVGSNATVSPSGAVQVHDVPPFTVSQFPPCWVETLPVPRITLPESVLS
jgi:hypothetical protein